jgi:capsid portal protein
MLAAHRVPPQLMGAIPEGNGSFGDVEKAASIRSQRADAGDGSDEAC